MPTTDTYGDANVAFGQIDVPFNGRQAASGNIKTWDGVARANWKTFNGLAEANVKTVDGVTA